MSALFHGRRQVSQRVLWSYIYASLKNLVLGQSRVCISSYLDLHSCLFEFVTGNVERVRGRSSTVKRVCAVEQQGGSQRKGILIIRYSELSLGAKRVRKRVSIGWWLLEVTV